MPPSSSSSQSASFHRLAEPVRRWIWRKGWQSLHDIQERAISTILDDDRDVIIAAPTAGGKTEAAFLPLISHVLEQPRRGGFDLVYVGPLRALINDQFERLEELCDAVELPVHPWHGDISRSVKARARRRPGGILLITPESLEALFVLRGLEVPTLFSTTRAIVIDELHAMLDNERGIHLASVLNRMELATGFRIRRIGLSATLGKMELAKQYLRPPSPEAVTLLKSSSDAQELRVQIRAYVQSPVPASNGTPAEAESSAARRSAAQHMFEKLRGSRNLVFAGSRQTVEWYADTLREMSEKARLPVEFFPHHASLSREHRTHLEHRLKSHPATTVVCTSTLELGIDIGDIACVAQIGAPSSVASLRQRLGRSGRRTGQAAVLRMYAVETEPDGRSEPLERLHLGLIRSIAMVELLVEGWCEPPIPHALHLSTLVHQILSVISELGGSNARTLYTTLCAGGPFRQVQPELFTRLLRWIGQPDVALIEQAPDGTLLLGRQGERLVEHYSFYAVFQTPEEYRIVADGKAIGTLPVSAVLTVGMTIIFSGRRWRIAEIHDRDKIIEVTADHRGRPPPFGGAGGAIHDRVAEKMVQVLEDADRPIYIDETAATLLQNARSEFQRLDFVNRPITRTGKRTCLIATGAGTVKTSTLALVLRAHGYTTEVHDGFLQVGHNRDIAPVETVVTRLAGSPPPEAQHVASGRENLLTEKFHPYLGRDLLLADAASSRLDFAGLPELARRLITPSLPIPDAARPTERWLTATSARRATDADGSSVRHGGSETGLTFNAIDVETANADRASICQIGVVQVIDGQIADTWETLVDPQEPFDCWNVRIHGIDEAEVQGSPTMPQIRAELRRRLRGSFLVSHTGFDRVAFERAMNKHRLEQLQVTWLDSETIARNAWPDNIRWNLKVLADRLGLSFRHHNALEDAKVVAQVVLTASHDTGRGIEDWLYVSPSIRGTRQRQSTPVRRKSVNMAGPLLGHRVVFTGELSMVRDDAESMAAQVGIVVADNVTRKTTMLVVGMRNRGLQKLYGKSGKHKRAEELIQQGLEIEILSEEDFLELVRF